MTKEENKIFTIYKITNTVNKKFYIGITSHSINKRWIRHKSLAKKGNKKCRLHNAMNKYGADNFIIEQIELIDHVSYEEAMTKEKDYIDIFKSYQENIGYNMTLGGEGVVGHEPWCKGKTKESDPIVKKISECQKSKGNSFYGKTHTDELKEKWSKERRGANHPCFGKKRPDLAVKNSSRVWTDQQKRAIGSKNSKSIMCNETKERFSSVKEMCEKLSLDQRAVHRVISGKHRHHKGFTFAYL